MPTRIRKSFGLLLFAGTFLINHSSAQGQQPAASGGLNLGQAAPDFMLSNIEGKRIQLKDYHGKKNVALVFYPALFRAGG
jgi:cytochrome oxidase Cu insertion factor (SCO1/SenC/PrrC family)